VIIRHTQGVGTSSGNIVHYDTHLLRRGDHMVIGNPERHQYRKACSPVVGGLYGSAVGLRWSRRNGQYTNICSGQVLV
jgi:hypothetical protein